MFVALCGINIFKKKTSRHPEYKKGTLDLSGECGLPGIYNSRYGTVQYSTVQHSYSTVTVENSTITVQLQVQDYQVSTRCPIILAHHELNIITYMSRSGKECDRGVWGGERFNINKI